MNPDDIPVDPDTLPNAPRPGSRWQMRNGEAFTVAAILANIRGRDGYVVVDRYGARWFGLLPDGTLRFPEGAHEVIPAPVSVA